MSVLLLGAATACSPKVADEVDDDAAWRTSGDPVDTGGLVWAVGSTVHLGDGSTFETGAPMRALLLGGDGAFFVPLDPEGDHGRFVGADLFFVDASGGDAVDTGLDVDDEGVAVTPDGTHLAVLATDHDSGAAEMRLYDLTSGASTTTEEGFDTDPADRVRDLDESEVAILAITDDEVYARTTGGDVVYDLDSGEARELGVDEVVPGSGEDRLRSPDGAWRIEQGDGLRDVLAGASGADVVPDTGSRRWSLTRWLDRRTVLGITVDGPSEGEEIGPDDVLALMTCQVPAGACRTVPGTRGELVLLPLGPGGERLDLRPLERG
ncbi:hypothetical protein GCM10009797_38230 [Nocardioides hwasunensis]